MMGMQTTADENLAEARQRIHEAIVALNRIVILQCTGHDDFTRDYQANIEHAYLNLLEIRKRLSR